MSNEVQTQTAGGAVAGLANLKAGLANVSAGMPTANTEPFLRMGTDGIWVYGADNVEVQDGSLWAVNIMSLQHGYAAWTDRDKQKNEKVGDIMVPFSQALPPRSSLQVHEDGGKTCPWREQYSFVLQCVSGEDKGTQVLYNTMSYGGTKAIKDLIAAVMAQLDADETKPIPVISLKNDHYPHKQYGKTYTPLLVIKKWVPMAETADAAVAEASEPDQSESPPAQADESTEASTESQPPRRRRRAA